MPVYKAEAIILRRRPLGEADRVLVVFSREFGKLSAVARGVRKTTSKLAGRLEPFSHVFLLVAHGRGALDVLAQVEVVEETSYLRDDLRRFGQAALAAELLEAAVPEREPHPRLFELLLETFRLLNGSAEAQALPWFALQLIAAVGFQPALDHCAVGGEPIQGTRAWSHPLGGIVCGRHAGRDPLAVRLRPEMVRLLGDLMAADAGGVAGVSGASRDLGALLELLRRYAEHRLEMRLRSPAVLDQLR